MAWYKRQAIFNLSQVSCMKIFIPLLLVLLSGNSFANSLPNTLEKIKPSIVAIGAISEKPNPKSTILGTGFVIGDGTLVATNAHVVNQRIFRTANKHQLSVFVGQGRKVTKRQATIISTSELYDIAILRISGSPLKPLILSDQRIREGENFAFTGFPIANALGLYPVTHQGIISSISPIATPATNTKELTPKRLRALKNPYDVYLLNAVAYPGNSGSPVYDTNTGKVIAMINKVLVKSTKESALSSPTAITYAISIKHLKELL